MSAVSTCILITPHWLVETVVGVIIGHVLETNWDLPRGIRGSGLEPGQAGENKVLHEWSGIRTLGFDLRCRTKFIAESTLPVEPSAPAGEMVASKRRESSPGRHRPPQPLPPEKGGSPSP